MTQNENNEKDSFSMNENSENVSNSVETKLEEDKTFEEDWKDKYFRLYADFENFRKRSMKEKVELSNLLKSDIVCKFLPILDDLERAIANMNNDDKNSPIFEVVKMLQSKYKNILTNLGITELEIMLNEDTLNPSKHEAITTIATDNESHKGKILDVVEKGYVLNNNIVRFAKVILGS